MKIKYFYYELKSAFGHQPIVSTGHSLIGAAQEFDSKETYFTCLCNLTDTLDMCLDILKVLENVQTGVMESDSVGLNDDSLIVWPDYVQMDIYIADEFIDQPEGRFTHDQIRKAVEGKIQFLKMEKIPGVELVVDIG